MRAPIIVAVGVRGAHATVLARRRDQLGAYGPSVLHRRGQSADELRHWLVRVVDAIALTSTHDLNGYVATQAEWHSARVALPAPRLHPRSPYPLLVAGAMLAEDRIKMRMVQAPAYPHDVAACPDCYGVEWCDDARDYGKQAGYPNTLTSRMDGLALDAWRAGAIAWDIAGKAAEVLAAKAGGA